MNREWGEAVRMYVETEAEVKANSMKLYTTMVLEYFGKYLDTKKGEGWKPVDVTNEDVVRFYLESHGDGESDADRYLSEIRRFIKFIKVREVYGSDPEWKRLFENGGE